MNDYWTGGVETLTKASYYDSSHIEITWKWSGQTSFLFSYWKGSSVSYTDGLNLFLYYNGSMMSYTGGHEYRSAPPGAVKKYICEASGLNKAQRISC